MNKLDIHLENCFGIRKFDCTFTFTKGKNTAMIYAPNGTMKTSFAKTMSIISKNDPKQRVYDQLFEDRSSISNVFTDDKPIDPINIFVVNAEDDNYDASAYCSTFLASKELKQEYDKIYNELITAKNLFIKKLKSDSISSDCEEEIIKTFSETERDSLFDCLLRIESNIHDGYTTYEFKYNNIFDKAGKVKIFLDKHQTELDEYLSRYASLLEKSSLYHKTGEHNFGTFQANQLHQSVSDGAFFGVNHKIVLSDGTVVDTASVLSNIMDREKTKLLADEALKERFDKITKAIDANQDLRYMKMELEKDHTLIAELAHYEDFRKAFWMGHLCKKEMLSCTKDLIALYKGKLEDLKKLVAVAQKENETWKNIIKLYQSRFHVPFEVSITNVEDVVLKEAVPNLQFNYICDGKLIPQDKSKLVNNILSKGERRALFILQMLFEIEGRRYRDEDQLLIFDDVADSFDYQNKYAIIEYLNDLQKDPSAHYKSILLTHNFDFYRTVSSRLGIETLVYYATRDDSGCIELSIGYYRYRNPFDVIQQNTDKDMCYVCMIPFVRNLVEYHLGQDSNEYKKLTNCLHVKDDTKTITDQEISLILQQYNGGKIWKHTESHKPIFNIIMDAAQSVVDQAVHDAMQISAKVTLAIAIRLLAEDYMITELQKAHVAIKEISKNQESCLLRKCKENDVAIKNINLLERVNVITPENIHINSFMYEPLVDMSIGTLIDLYKQCKTL